MSAPRRRLPVLDAAADVGCTRREFLRGTAALAATAAVAGCSPEELLGKHFQELSPDQLARRIRRIERDASRRYGRTVAVSTAPARPGVVFGYGLDLSRCAGCRRCVYACVEENNASRGNPAVQWIKVLELDKAHGVDLAHATPYYGGEPVPRPGHFYMPAACQQCRKPACVKVCPAGATWKEPDGIVVVDYDWCIGCRCCMAACPYGARRFNWAQPEVPPEALNPTMHYLGNRPRRKSTVEKCTFCIQRVRDGRYPACVEVCPRGARKFGNLLDPGSEIRQIMDRKRVFILKAELGTAPQFYYFYG
ncbi:MAG TPA: 4Fe-4S dicluster domain-containing protein [Anaeromyxobacteraceae bacterium]|nr:4Fe-4S dicluster domain-containing protein [Anaeromyxobacteraceae bacterium]